MPNWVYNGLTIEGNPEQVNKLVEQMNKPFTRLHDNYNKDTGKMEVSTYTFSNPVFSFQNIYSYKDAGITDLEYVAQPDHSLPIEEAMLHKGKSWYDFNNREWGTKWDVAVSNDEKYPDTYIEGPTENGENLVVYYNFNTAWSVPVPAIQKLSAQYPTLLFTLSYEEEQGWGGEMELLRGEVISESEYDNKCRDCDAENTMEYCEECENEICSSCNWLGEADLESVAECQTHKIYLETKVPEYRKAEA